MNDDLLEHHLGSYWDDYFNILEEHLFLDEYLDDDVFFLVGSII